MFLPVADIITVKPILQEDVKDSVYHPFFLLTDRGNAEVIGKIEF